MKFDPLRRFAAAGLVFSGAVIAAQGFGAGMLWISYVVMVPLLWDFGPELRTVKNPDRVDS